MDTESLALLRRQWNNIEDELIRAIDVDYGVYEGRSFREHRFAQWSAAQGIPWPRLETGHLDMADDTFRQMARAYPAVSPLRELRSSLSDLRLEDLAVGRDGFNRTILSCFRARSGRNAPSNTRYIFGPSVWLRNLIKPPPGYGVAYVDWQQQEHGIAGALSGDAALQAAYVSGDPYLEFARQAGAVPPDATKHSHPNERELFKQCTLAVAYGMGAQGLARRINCIPIVSRDLLRAHQETYRQFWRWSDAAVDHAVLTGTLTATFGWPIHVGEGFNPRSLRNFPMQANGAEMLRLATCYAVEAGLGVAALVHDAILIMAPADSLEADVAAVRGCMARASRDVLAGFELRTDATLIFHPDRYHDPRGAQMWRRVIGRDLGSCPTWGRLVDDQDPFDPASLRVRPAQQTRTKPKRWRRHYVQVPWPWVERLKAAKRISTYRLALSLVYASWRNGGRPIVLSNVMAEEEGLSRRSKWRALAELEYLGLVEVRRRPRQAPGLVMRHVTGKS